MINPTRRSFLTGAAAAALALRADASIFPWRNHKHRLSNPNASPRARKLYSYLWSLYGHHTLTGQQLSAIPSTPIPPVCSITRALMNLRYHDRTLPCSVPSPCFSISSPSASG